MTDQGIGKIIAGKYRLEAVIGFGASGNLYRATHLLMERSVTLRVLDNNGLIGTNGRDAFFEEARTQAQVSHPNILNVVDFGTDLNGDLYVVYDAVNCETLPSFIRQNGRLEIAHAVEFARQIAAGLAAAHSAGLIHGNLSGDSVLLSEVSEGAVIAKISDFGTTGPLYREDANAADFAYLPPEQCVGADEPGVCGDIYSLGVIFYEMLAGEAPFATESAAEMMRLHSEEPPPPLVSFRADLPAGIESVVLKALSKNPEMRYQGAAEFIGDLDGLFHGSIQPSALAAKAAPAGEFWKTVILTVAGISILAAALIYATSVRQTDPATQAQPETNGLPVQPINPATGVEEQNLVGLPGSIPEYVGNSNTMQPGIFPGGDGYDPWASGGLPPGAPKIPQGGQTITIDPNSGSPFMPPEGCVLQPSGILLCPKPLTGNANTAARPSPTPRPSPSANTAVPGVPPTNTPPRSTPTPKPPIGETKPSPRPTARAKSNDGAYEPRIEIRIKKTSLTTPVTNTTDCLETRIDGR